MAVTLSNNEKKALNELFASLQEKRGFSYNLKKIAKKVKDSILKYFN